jgi:DNA-binding CsgD family transcriptional regulator
VGEREKQHDTEAQAETWLQERQTDCAEAGIGLYIHDARWHKCILDKTGVRHRPRQNARPTTVEIHKTKMARLATSDKADLKDALHALRRPEPAWPWPSFLEQLRVLLNAQRVVLYSVQLGARGYRLDFGHWVGFSRSSTEMNLECEGLLANASRPWALFDPIQPETAQRNRAVVLRAPQRWRDREGMQILRRLGFDGDRITRLIGRMERLNAKILHRIELADMHVCRALLCERERPLAHLGAYRQQPFSERERLLLHSLLPALQERLRREHLVLGAGMHAAAARTMIEAIDQPCFVVTEDAAIELANKDGLALAQGEADIRADIRLVIQGRPSRRFSAQPLHDADPVKRYLVRARPNASGPSTRLRQHARRWRLSDREATVLSRLVEGLPNKEIASVLGCQVRTVEFHLTRIFGKAGVDGRAALITRFWSG